MQPTIRDCRLLYAVSSTESSNLYEPIARSDRAVTTTPGRERGGATHLYS